mgnify:FL=1|jgi:hypothetical protein
MKQTQLQNMIEFFKTDPENDQIYAHKEYYFDSEGISRTRIKTKEQILAILREESLLLR